ncbi:Rid family hydrolase [Mycoplasma sp. ATU-Cv-508]|uniref:Rid family hydrolase n=1 Tax=Mycoplasma sp. ATU-Cv-508 TaxID=2048001 RepID=UPI001EEF3204
MKFINTEKAPVALGPYSQAIQVDKLVFLSGQLGIDPQTHRFGLGVEEQTLWALENLGHVLFSVGLDKTDVVKCTIFVKNMDDFCRH